MEKVIIDGGRGICEYDSREEFIKDMIAANQQDSGEDYNDGEGIKTFLEACDYYIARDGNITITSGEDVVCTKKSKLYLNGKVQFNCRS